jgi:hypothetical protein
MRQRRSLRRQYWPYSCARARNTAAALLGRRSIGVRWRGGAVATDRRTKPAANRRTRFRSSTWSRRGVCTRRACRQPPSASTNPFLRRRVHTAASSALRPHAHTSCAGACVASSASAVRRTVRHCAERYRRFRWQPLRRCADENAGRWSRSGFDISYSRTRSAQVLQHVRSLFTGKQARRAKRCARACMQRSVL